MNDGLPKASGYYFARAGSSWEVVFLIIPAARAGDVAYWQLYRFGKVMMNNHVGDIVEWRGPIQLPITEEQES